MSRSTRASIVSSLLALSLAAAGCGDRAPYDRAEVENAFAASGIQFGSNPLNGVLATSHAPPARPLNDTLYWLRHASRGDVLPPPRLLPARAYLLDEQDRANAWIFATNADAIRARHAVESAAEAIGFDRRFAVERRGNVLVFYDASVERRVQTALDRLDD